MSYRCEVCCKAAPPGNSKQVYKGVALCPKCMRLVRQMELGELSVPRQPSSSESSVASMVAKELIASFESGQSPWARSSS
jgi:hypothetical protein